MAKRYVRATGKDRQGDITRLCNSGDYWSRWAAVVSIADRSGAFRRRCMSG